MTRLSRKHTKWKQSRHCHFGISVGLFVYYVLFFVLMLARFKNACTKAIPPPPSSWVNWVHCYLFGPQNIFFCVLEKKNAYRLSKWWCHFHFGELFLSFEVLWMDTIHFPTWYFLFISVAVACLAQITTFEICCFGSLDHRIFWANHLCHTCRIICKWIMSPLVIIVFYTLIWK